MEHLGVEVGLDRDHDHLGEFLSITTALLGKDLIIATTAGKILHLTISLSKVLLKSILLSKYCTIISRRPY